MTAEDVLQDVQAAPAADAEASVGASAGHSLAHSTADDAMLAPPPDALPQAVASDGSLNLIESTTAATSKRHHEVLGLAGLAGTLKADCFLRRRQLAMVIGATVAAHAHTINRKTAASTYSSFKRVHGAVLDAGKFLLPLKDSLL